MGCSLEEKANPQPIDVTIKLHFFNEPFGCQSDQLYDVACYKTIVDTVIQTITNRSFNLIEFVAAQIFNAIASQLTQNGVLEVNIAKPHHPVANVHEPVVFKFARRLPQTSL